MSRIWLIAGAAFVGVLVVATVALTLLQREQSFDDGTPERAVQDFLKAYADEDFGRVYDMWSEELRSDCGRDELIQHAVGSGGRLDDVRVRITDTEYVGDDRRRAVVLTRETHVSGDGPFNTSEWSNRQRYSLVLEQGQWRFAEAPPRSPGCPPDESRGGMDGPRGPDPSRPPTG